MSRIASLPFTQVCRKRRLKGGLECNYCVGVFSVEAVHTNYATVLVEFWLGK